MSVSGKKIGLIIGILVSALVLVAGTLIFLFVGNGGTADARSSRLDAPTNLQVSNDYILTFDEVEDSIRYEITIDGASKFSSTNSFDLTPYLNDYRQYVLAVRAIYKISSFSSVFSSNYLYDYTCQLDSPTLQIVLDQLQWDSIGDNDTTYNLTIYKNNEIEPLEVIDNIEDCFYKLEDITTWLGEAKMYRFTVRAENKQNSFIHTSDGSNVVRYYMSSSLDDFVIEMDASNNMRTIYFEEVAGADDYSIVIDNVIDENQTYTKQNIDGKVNIVFDLTSNINANILGDHNIQVYAVVTEEEYAPYISQGESNILEYTLTRKLPTPTGLTYYKQGANLRITWNSVKDSYGYEASGYTICIYDSNDSLSKTITITAVSGTTCFYDEPLTTRPDGLFKVCVQANINALYYYSSDFTAMPETAYSAITQLDTPTGVSLVAGADGTVTALWNSVDWANAGYMVTVQQWDMDTLSPIPDSIYYFTTEARADAYRLDITTLAMPAGLYKCKIVAIGYDYYQQSEPTIDYSFTFQKRLDSPTNLAFTYGDKNLTWSKVTNAVGYEVYINSSIVTTAVISDLDDSSMQADLTQYFYGKSAGWYKMTVVAVADVSEDSLFINSAKSAILSISYMPKFNTPTGLTINGGEDYSNDRTFSWDDVNNASSYSVYVNSVLVGSNINTTTFDIGSYLTPGTNEIGIKANTTTSFAESDLAMIDYDYIYYLQSFESSKLQLTATNVMGEPNYTLSFPAVRIANKYVVNIYVNDSLINSYSPSEYDTNGNIVSFEIPEDQFALFVNNTLTLVPSYTKPNGITEDYVLVKTGTVWPSTTFYNEYYLPSPADLTANSSTMQASWTYGLDAETIALIGGGLHFAWSISGASMGEGSVDTTSLDLSDFILYEGTDEQISGIYVITVYAYCDTVISQSVTFTLAIDLTLADVENITYTDGVLSWDTVLFAKEYSVEIQKFNGTDYDTISTINTGSSTEWFVLDDLVDAGLGVYRFKVNASTTYKDNQGQQIEVTSQGYSSDLNFTNQLSTPTIYDLTITNGDYFILTNKINNANGYVANFGGTDIVFTVGDSGVVIDGASVWLKVTDYVAGLSANSYTVTLQATDSTNIHGASAISAGFAWNYTKTFASPSDLTITQTNFALNSMELTATWTPSVIDSIYCDYLIKWYRGGSLIGSDTVVGGSGFDGNYTFNVTNADTYSISVQAVPKLINETYYLASEVYSVDFIVVTQFTAPTLNLVGGSELEGVQYVEQSNSFSQTISFAILGNTTTHFSLRVTNITDINASVMDYELYANINLTNYVYSLSKDYFAKAGVYSIQVRYQANGNYASSEFSSPCYIYYTVDLPAITGISAGKTVTEVSVLFTEPEDEFENITGYSVTVYYGADLLNSVNTTLTVGNHLATFTDANLLAFWLDNNVVKIKVETSFSNINIGSEYPIANFGYYVASSYTEKTITIGNVGVPTVHFVDNGSSAVFTWDADSQGYSATYNYNLTVTNILTGADTVYTNVSTGSILTFSYDKDAAVPYTFYIEVQAHITTPTAQDSAWSSNTFISNAVLGLQPADFDITYNDLTDTYTATWTNVYSGINQTSYTFEGYTLVVGGYTLDTSSLVLTDGTMSISFSGTTMRTYMEALPNSNQFAFTLGIGNVTYTSGNTYVLYMSSVVSNSIALDMYIDTAVSNVTVTDNVASWDEVNYVQNYFVEIGTSSLGDYSDFVTSVSFTTSGFENIDLSSYYLGLTVGNYVVRVSVADSSGIYVPSTKNFVTSSYASIVVTKAYNTVSSLQFNTTEVVDSTYYNKIISWSKDSQYDIENAIFRVYITDSQNNNVLDGMDYITLGNELNVSATVDDYFVIGSTRISYNLNKNGTGVLSALTAGTYYAKVMICGYGLYNDSVVSSSLQMANKFIWTKPASHCYSILPDAWVTYDAENYTVTPITGHEQDYASYIEKFGYNTKYFVLTQQVEVASSLSLYFNNVFITQNIVNEVAWDGTYASFYNLSPQNRVNITNYYFAGDNVIKLISGGSTTYYASVDGDTSNNTLEEDVTLYTQLITPYVTDYSIKLTYSDTAKNNVSVIDFTFKNGSTVAYGTSDIGAKFGFNLYKETEVSGTYAKCNSDWLIFTLSSENFINGSNSFNYNDIIDFVSQYGVGRYYLQVCRFATENYYINSSIANTGADGSVKSIFIYQYRIDNFTGISNDGGELMWNLPTINFDLDVKYSVRMTSQLGANLYATFYNCVVSCSKDNEGKMVYAFVGNHDYYTIDLVNGTITFDMTTYFEDNTTRSTGYYLAGLYGYTIYAEPNVAKTYISNANVVTNNNYEYIINYPGILSNVYVDENYNLIWSYTDNDKLNLFLYNFEIYVNGDISTYSGTYLPGEFLVNILNKLTVKDNVVKIRAIIPSEYNYDNNSLYEYAYYYNGEWVDADLTQLPVVFALPDFIIDDCYWLDTSDITWQLEEISSTLKSDPNKGTLGYQVTLQQLSSDGTTVENEITFDFINSEAETMAKYSLVDAINATNPSAEVKAIWLTGDILVPGLYVVKIQFLSTSTYYSASTIELAPYSVTAKWQISKSTDTNYLYGDDVINVALDKTMLASSTWTTNSKVQNWLNTDIHHAYLQFSVILVDGNNPTDIFTRLSSLDTIYEYKYDEANSTWLFGVKGNLNGSQADRVTFVDTENENIKIVVIDVGNMFDELMLADAYDVTYYLGDDTFASKSEEMTTDSRYSTVHVVQLPELILNDDLEYINNGEDFVINWTSERELSADTQFGVNIVVKNANGDTTSSIGAYTNYDGSAPDYYTYNDYDAANFSNNRLTLTLNVYNYVAIQATTYGGGTGNYASKFYIPSGWSEVVSYMYLQPLGAPTQYATTAVFTMDENNMPMENADNSNIDCYDITFAAPDNAVAYELYVYDPTQVENGSIKQVSHIYFGQDTNLSGLIYMYDATAIENSHIVVCGKLLGRQTNNIVSVSGFTLPELLGLSLNTPVTFSYILKAWTNDYDAEGNALGYNFNVNHAKLLGQFEYKIKLQSASVTSVELIDDGDYFDISNNGIQYLKYTSNANAIPTFKFKITMSGIYYTGISPLLNEIKRVDIIASIDRGFDLTKLSSFTINNQSVEQVIENNNAVLYITVDVATNTDYLEDMGTWIYTNLPNIINFQVQVSYDASSVNNSTYTDIDGITKSLNYSYDNSNTSASTENSQITLGKQLTTPTLELLYDNLSASGLSSVEIGGAGYETNLFDQGDDLSDFAANPYIYVNSSSTNYTWGATALSREAGEINSYATYSLTLSMDGKTDSIITGLTIADIQSIISIFNNTYNYSIDPSTRYDYLGGTDIFLNNSSALYQKLMAFIGTGKGGVVRLTLQTVADSGASNLWITGNISNVKVLDFYVRTSVITTSPLVDVTDSMFNCANSEIVTFMDRTSSATTSDVYRISTGNVIVNWQKSDYAQSYISMWTYDATGSKVATYNYIIENTTTSSQDIVNMVSKFTNTDYFRSYPGNIWDVSNINNGNDKRGWYVITVTPIIPTSVIADYVCGTYPSKTVTYKNKVKFVNKIDLTIETSVSVSNNVPTLNEANVDYTSGATLNQTAAFLELSVNGNAYYASISTSGTLQENLSSTILSLLNTGFGSVTSGGLYDLYFRYKTSASSTTTNPNSNIFPSNYTSAIQYRHYYIREIGYQVMQSGGALVVTAYYKDNNAIVTSFSQDSLDNITFTLKQNGGTSRSTTSISTGNSSYYGFNPSRADCFDYSSTIFAANCLNGYTSYIGCIQAGINYFEAYCDLKDEASVNNCYDIVWGKDSGLTGAFYVPSDYSPAVYVHASGTLVKEALNLTDWDSTPEDIEAGCPYTITHGQSYLKTGLSSYTFYKTSKVAEKVTWETGYNWTLSPYGTKYNIRVSYSVDDESTLTTDYTTAGSFSIPNIDTIKSSKVSINISGYFRSGFASYMLGSEFSNFAAVGKANVEQVITYPSTSFSPFSFKCDNGDLDFSHWTELLGTVHWNYTISDVTVTNNTVFNLDCSVTWYIYAKVNWVNFGVLEGTQERPASKPFTCTILGGASYSTGLSVEFYHDWQAWSAGDATYGTYYYNYCEGGVTKIN